MKTSSNVRLLPAYPVGVSTGAACRISPLLGVSPHVAGHMAVLTALFGHRACCIVCRSAAADLAVFRLPRPFQSFVRV